jgi:hypothetical protein
LSPPMTVAQTKVTPHHSNTQRSAQPIMPSPQKHLRGLSAGALKRW